MSPATPDRHARRTERIRDIIADNEAIRDGLNDDDSLALIRWGRAQAEHIAARLDDADRETVDERAGTLMRLMTRINWVVNFRQQKDAAWLREVLQKLNALSTELYGETAPTMTDDAINTLITEHADRSNSTLLRDLMNRFAPPTAEDESAPEAPPPLSNSVDLPGLELPGRASPTGDDDEQEE